MSYGEVYANRGGSLLMDLGVTVAAGRYGEGTRAMLLIAVAEEDFVYNLPDGEEDLFSIRHIDLRVFDPTDELYFGPPR